MGSPVVDVEVHCDLACPWSHVAVRWLRAASAHRPLRPRLRPYSLALRPDDAPVPEVVTRWREASLPALRVMEVLGTEDPPAVDPFWDVLVARATAGQPLDVVAALGAAGADPGAASAADDRSIDDRLRASMAAVDRVVGAPTLLPALVLDRQVAFIGPLLRTAPDGDAAAQLWDAVVVLARTPGFYELSRPRPRHPELPGLPSTPEPPRLGAATRLAVASPVA